MYNEELKKKFIESEIKTKSRKTIAEVCFEATQKYEEYHDADLCTLSSEDLKPILSQIIGIRASGEVTRTSVLKLYAKWCIASQYPGACDALLTTKPDTVGKFALQSVSSPQHLQSILNAVFGSDEDISVDCIYKGFFWMGFIGVPEEISVKITVDNVDLEDRVILFSDESYRGEFPICNEALPVIEKLVKLDAFEVIHPLYPENKKIKPRYCSRQLLRGLRSNKTVRDLRRISFDKMNASNSPLVKDHKITYSRVLISGVFYRMWCAEQGSPDGDKMTVDFSGYIRDLPGNENISATLLAHKERFMREDYEKWKQAYGMTSTRI